MISRLLTVTPPPCNDPQVNLMLGPSVARRALGGVAGSETPATSCGARRALVRLLLALHAAREARRARRGTASPCGCAPVHVKACVIQGRSRL